MRQRTRSSLWDSLVPHGVSAISKVELQALQIWVLDMLYLYIWHIIISNSCGAHDALDIWFCSSFLTVEVLHEWFALHLEIAPSSCYRACFATVWDWVKPGSNRLVDRWNNQVVSLSFFSCCTRTWKSISHLSPIEHTHCSSGSSVNKPIAPTGAYA